MIHKTKTWTVVKYPTTLTTPWQKRGKSYLCNFSSVDMESPVFYFHDSVKAESRKNLESAVLDKCWKWSSVLDPPTFQRGKLGFQVNSVFLMRLSYRALMIEFFSRLYAARKALLGRGLGIWARLFWVFLDMQFWYMQGKCMWSRKKDGIGT